MFVIGLHVPLMFMLFFDSCPVLFEYLFLVFVPMHLFSIVACFLILSCLSSVADESQKNFLSESLLLMVLFGCSLLAELCR